MRDRPHSMRLIDCGPSQNGTLSKVGTNLLFLTQRPFSPLHPDRGPAQPRSSQSTPSTLGGTGRQIHYPSLKDCSSGRARPLSHYMTRVIAPSCVVRILICPFSCACSGRDGSYFSGIFISFFDSILPKQQLLDGK